MINGGFLNMIIEKIVEKFKDVLSEEDLKIFQEELTNFINEESQKRADLKIEEKTKAINEASEKFIAEAKDSAHSIHPLGVSVLPI